MPKETKKKRGGRLEQSAVVEEPEVMQQDADEVPPDDFTDDIDALAESEPENETDEPGAPVEGEVLDRPVAEGNEGAVPAGENAWDKSYGTPAEKNAWEHKVAIEAMAVKAQVLFLDMGKLLYDAREKAEWSILHYESFKEYIEDLKLPMTESYSWATRLISIYEYMVLKYKIAAEILAKIGVAKLTRLIPVARKGELTPELLSLAQELSDLDLRQELGHNVGDSSGDGEPKFATCPRCGFDRVPIK
ncbi:MAG: hypothetical protein KJ604_20595 [Gammaproteobacteria bacterium]|nr:hypothetical protein [Gammaproteobacteria bacterium]